MRAIRTGLVGQSISYSQSPLLHEEFARQSGLRVHYELIETDAESLSSVVHDFFEQGGHGLNVTVPHKFRAARLADCQSPEVKRSGACNVLTAMPDGTIRADNVDGVAFVRDLSRLGFCEDGMNVLVLGAGGAAAGIMPALLDNLTDFVHVYNRDATRATNLLEKLNDRRLALWTRGLQYDLIVNATSASSANVVPSFPLEILGHAKWAYDLAYAPVPTPFMRLATEHEMLTADGWGMLVAQAAETFALWHGHVPQWESLIKARH